MSKPRSTKKGFLSDHLEIISYSILVVVSLLIGHSVGSYFGAFPSFSIMIGLTLVLSGILILDFVYKRL